VREKHQVYEVTYRGRVVARLVPSAGEDTDAWDADKWMADWSELGRQISESWPAGVSAVQAVREQRREL